MRSFAFVFITFFATWLPPELGLAHAKLPTFSNVPLSTIPSRVITPIKQIWQPSDELKAFFPVFDIKSSNHTSTTLKNILVTGLVYFCMEVPVPLQVKKSVSEFISGANEYALKKSILTRHGAGPEEASVFDGHVQIVLFFISSIEPLRAIVTDILPKIKSPNFSLDAIKASIGIDIFPPAKLFAIGVGARAIQLCTNLKHAFNPSIGVCALLNFGSNWSNAKWASNIVVGWAVTPFLLRQCAALATAISSLPVFARNKRNLKSWAKTITAKFRTSLEHLKSNGVRYLQNGVFDRNAQIVLFFVSSMHALRAIITDVPPERDRPKGISGYAIRTAISLRLFPPRKLFAIGASARALQLCTTSQYNIRPTLEVCALINFVATWAKAWWVPKLVVGWVLTPRLWRLCGARIPTKDEDGDGASSV